MISKKKILLKVVAFIAVFAILFSAANRFFQPIRLAWNNYSTTFGFYEEPKNTIETVFLGTSVVVTGVAPMELYEDFGICAYNLSTEQQPVLASYYWLEEAYRLHSETLKTVFFDVSGLRADASDIRIHKAFDGMKFSKTKARAMWEYAEGDAKKALEFLIPLVSYHDRWSSIDKKDFDKYSYTLVNGTRGYDFRSEMMLDNKTSDKIKVKNPILSAAESANAFGDETMVYLERMVSFCKEKGLKLVLIRTPAIGWSSANHQETLDFAEANGLEFYDFNYDPYYTEIGYIHVADSVEGSHMNYFGAAKFTNWFGKYLVENCGATDVRGNAKYSYMEEQLAIYNKDIKQKLSLMETTSVSDYLKQAISEDNTVIIAVREDGANALTEEQRDVFASLGLTELSKLEYRSSYLSVVQNGEVLHEAIKLKTEEDGQFITYNGILSDGKEFEIKSGAFNHGDVSSIKIDGTEYASNTTGISIAVYNNSINKVVDNVCFNTSVGETRESYTVDFIEELKDTDNTQQYAQGGLLDQIAKYYQRVQDKRNGIK